jgi:hypothetical protein
LKEILNRWFPSSCNSETDETKAEIKEETKGREKDADLVKHQY